MSAYLDTSVLVALFFHEDASTAARERAGRESQLWASRWTLAEAWAGAMSVAAIRCSSRTTSVSSESYFRAKKAIAPSA